MKKVLFIFLLFLFLVLGVAIGGEPNRGSAGIIRKRTKEFEDEISIPDNQYNYEENIITPNLNNQIAQKGGNIIKGVFDFSFGVIKNLIE